MGLYQGLEGVQAWGRRFSLGRVWQGLWIARPIDNLDFRSIFPVFIVVFTDSYSLSFEGHFRMTVIVFLDFLFFFK